MEKIQFKRPELEDKEIIDSYFALAPSRSCERTFANVFLWSRHYHAQYAIFEDTLIFTYDDSECAYSYPVGNKENVKKALDGLIAYSEIKQAPLWLYCVMEEDAAQLEEWYPGEFFVEYDRDQADYVYEREKLATLAGKKLHGKRNHINKFKALYPDWSYEPISDENVEECFQMALTWRNQNGCEEDEEKNAEMCVTLNSLRLYKELGLKGGVLRVNGSIVAFTLGEPACEDTFVVHIEKAFSDIEGAYTVINQQFVQHACEGYMYVNREDDTGAEGLRQAKLSYRPAFLVNKGAAVRNLL